MGIITPGNGEAANIANMGRINVVDFAFISIRRRGCITPWGSSRVRQLRKRPDILRFASVALGRLAPAASDGAPAIVEI